MIVVSDASPINVLVRIGHEMILPALFGQVVIPPAVLRELTHTSTPSVVRTLALAAPAWLRVQAPTRVDPTMPFDDPGEREAICLAMELHADYVLVDDRRARRAATERGLVVTGTVGVLELAARADLLRLDAALTRLRATDFMIAPAILDDALRRDHARRQTP